jgi:hypothetical protein
MAKTSIPDPISKYIDEAIARERILFKLDIAELTKDFKNHTGALMEDLKHRIAIVAEMVQHIADKIDAMTIEIEEIRIKLDSKIGYREYYMLEKRITALEKKLNKKP